jgi:hypothetical protein
MSSIALDESPFTKLLNSLEESLFSVIFQLQKTKSEDLVRINYLAGLASIILDFVQLLPFFVHGTFHLISFRAIFENSY